jgi:4-amino-4-deoxy-L-arabinose transferase
MALPFLASNFITTDTLVALFTALAGVSFLHLQAGLSMRRAAIGMWFGFGLAFLTKGPPALLTLPVFLGWLAYRRDRVALRHVFAWPGVLLFTVIASTWYLLADSRFPGLLDFLLRAEVAGRIASDVFDRNAVWYGGIAVYMPTLLIGGLPWLPAWLVFRRCRRLAPPVAVPADRLLLLWIGVPLLVFLLSRSRLPLYVLPLFVPLALWLARRFEPAARELRPERAGLVVVTCLVLLTAAKFGIAQLSTPQVDGRATAALINRVTDGPLDEVVFVDKRAVWALRFYLDTQVREAWLRRTHREPAFQRAPGLTELLTGKDEARLRLFMVHPASTHDFKQAMRAAGLCVWQLGHDEVSVAYRAAPIGTWRCG